MLEQISNAITFYAFYIDTKVAATGLTVTVDVYRNGTEIVTGGSASEAGDGLYYYQLASGSVTTEGVYIAVFKTATTSVDQQHLASAYLIGTAGIEYLDAAASSLATAASLATAQTDLDTLTGADGATLATSQPNYTPATAATAATAVWAAATRTLTASAASVAATVSGSDITIQRGDTVSISLTGLGDISTRSKLWFTVKQSRDLADSAAILQWEESVGLVYLNAAAATASDGAITVDDENAGDITVTLVASASASLPINNSSYDVQVLTSGGTVTTLTSASFSIVVDITRSVA